MNTDKYAEFAKIGNFTVGERDAKFLAALGLCGEAGEVSEIIKKHLLHGKDLDRDHLRKELGDVLWYFFHALNTFDMTFEEVANANIRKLCDRYPKGYGDPKKWLVGELASYKDDPEVPEYGGM
jgi:NTP pyrophosphatase (non-canonical NTP hydrolase)